MRWLLLKFVVLLIVCGSIVLSVRFLMTPAPRLDVGFMLLLVLGLIPAHFLGRKADYLWGTGFTIGTLILIRLWLPDGIESVPEAALAIFALITALAAAVSFHDVLKSSSDPANTLANEASR